MLTVRLIIDQIDRYIISSFIYPPIIDRRGPKLCDTGTPTSAFVYLNAILHVLQHHLINELISFLLNQNQKNYNKITTPCVYGGIV